MDYAENRWLQRFQNYQRALYHLDAAVQQGVEKMNPLEIQGLIKNFEIVTELGWKTLQDYLRETGFEDLSGPKPVVKRAYQEGLVDGEKWLEILEGRNQAAHTYDQELANTLAEKIVQVYYDHFDALDKKLTTLKNSLEA